jgi:hypothetical protein
MPFGEQEFNHVCPPMPRPGHNHEVQGSVEVTGPQGRLHNHRFCTVSGPAIPISGSDHVHEVAFTTDTYEGHDHEFAGRSGGAIRVGDRHVHYLESITTQEVNHRHRFRFATLIDDPIGD